MVQKSKWGNTYWLDSKELSKGNYKNRTKDDHGTITLIMVSLKR